MRIAPTRALFAVIPGECLKPETRWRRGWDSNPRATLAAAGFQGRVITYRPVSTWYKMVRCIRAFRTFIYDMRKNFRAFVPRIFSTDSGASEDSRSRVLRTGSTKPSACG